MSSNCSDSFRCCARNVKLPIILVISIFLFIPIQSFATSGIASRVAATCAPNPTVPDVGSCSACHSTTNNRGPNDLTAAGQWSLSPSTYMQFCPTTTTPPGPTPTPPPTTEPTPPPGMSPAPPTPGMGRGSGGSRGDDDDDDGDDDDDHEMEDDDDDGGSGALRSLRSRLNALRSRFRRD